MGFFTKLGTAIDSTFSKVTKESVTESADKIQKAVTTALEAAKAEFDIQLKNATDKIEQLEKCMSEEKAAGKPVTPKAPRKKRTTPTGKSE